MIIFAYSLYSSNPLTYDFIYFSSKNSFSIITFPIANARAKSPFGLILIYLSLKVAVAVSIEEAAKAGKF